MKVATFLSIALAAFAFIFSAFIVEPVSAEAEKTAQEKRAALQSNLLAKKAAKKEARQARKAQKTAKIEARKQANKKVKKQARRHR